MTEAAQVGRSWKWLLFGLILTGGVLRCVGIDFGLPLQLRPDEDILINNIRTMVASGSWHPKDTAYPSFVFYLQAAVLWIVHVVFGLFGSGSESFSAFLARDVPVTLVQRSLSVLLGIGTIGAVFCIGRRLGGLREGLLATAFCAFAYVHVRDSHFGTVDVPACFFAALCVALALRAVANESLRTLFAAGVCAGLAAACKYVPALLAASLVMAAWALPASGARWRRAAMGVGVAGIGMIVAFLAAAPHTVTDWQWFMERIEILRSMSSSDGSVALGARMEETFRLLEGALSAPLLACAALGILRVSRRRLVNTAFLVLYGVVIFQSNLKFARYGVLLAPFAAVSAAGAVSWLVEHFPSRARFGAAVAAVLLVAGISGVRSVRCDVLFARETTLEQARDWVAENLPRGKKIVASPPWIARRAGLGAVFAPFDPVVMAKQREVYVLSAELDHPFVGVQSGIRRLISAVPGASILARFPIALDSAKASFDEADAFLYPLKGFAGVERGGPEIVIYRVPIPPANSLGRPPAGSPGEPRLDRVMRGFVLSWDPPRDSGDVLAYYVYAQTEELFERGVIPKPRAVCAGLNRLEFPGGIPRGRFLVSIAAVNLAGAGPPTPPKPFAVE